MKCYINLLSQFEWNFGQKSQCVRGYCPNIYTVGKGFALALAGGATKNHKGNFMAAISLWIGLSLVPQLLFVRLFLPKILGKKLNF